MTHDEGTVFAKDGVKIHKYAEEWILRVIGKNLITCPEKWLAELTNQEKNRIGRAARKLVKEIKKQQRPDFQIVYIKPEFEIKNKIVSNLQINGYVDLIIELENPFKEKKRIIVDWKRTLRHNPIKEYDYQLKFYEELVREVRGDQNTMKILIGVEEDSEKRMRKVDTRGLEDLSDVIKKWETQETKPSIENCGMYCPRFTQGPRCDDAVLMPLSEIALDQRLTPFREKSLPLKVWETISNKGVFIKKDWNAKLILSKRESSVPVVKFEDGAVLCDVVGIARAQARPEMVKEIEIIIKSIVIQQ